LDEATVKAVKDLGGLAAIAVSHPHYYTTMVEWSHAFGKVPIYLHDADAKWVMRPDPARRPYAILFPEERNGLNATKTRRLRQTKTLGRSRYPALGTCPLNVTSQLTDFRPGRNQAILQPKKRLKLPKNSSQQNRQAPCGVLLDSLQPKQRAVVRMQIKTFSCRISFTDPLCNL
jgi:hypothetical protein